MAKSRKYYSPEEKVRIIKRHLLEGVSVSALCSELGLRPTVFYRWQKEFFEQGHRCFEPVSNKRKEDRLEQANADLSARIQQKDTVIADLLEDHVRLKKELGGA